MIEVYYPNKLIQARNRISEKHEFIASVNTSELQSDVFKDLILKLVNMSMKDLDGYAYTLNRKDLMMISIYLSENYYKINLSNIIYVFILRMNREILLSFYYTWQNYYINKETAKIFQEISVSNELENLFIQVCKLEPKAIIDEIRSERLPYYIAKKIINKNINTKSLFHDNLSKYQIKEDTLLGKRILQYYYTVCFAEEYLTLGEAGLLKMFENSSTELVKLILLNMLDKLDVDGLKKFYKILLYVMKHTGEIESSRFNKFFEDADQKLKNKFQIWVNLYNMYKTFGYDDRSIFWSRYAEVCTTKHIESTQMLILRFNSFVVVEFVNVGAIYWYEIEYFDSVVYYNCISYNNDTELKRWLNYQSKYLYRKEHRGYWTDDAASYTNMKLRQG